MVISSQNLLMEPRTLGKEEQVNQEGRWPGTFSTTPLARRNPPHFRERNKLWGVNIKTSELWGVFFKALGKEWEFFYLREEFGFTQKRISRKRKVSGWAFSYQSPGKWSKRRKGKWPTTNVLDITLVLVSRAPKGWIVYLEESSNNTIKRGKTQAKRIHSDRSP